ncbi:hypothetical protein BN7_1046 [Wickerhamomyces ciferrii]|uniref:Zn(2)-C6 fungal-type domain-containing protein n=1 Tax=Wickerhamomyces ciferrii (strain ATCC 14091 / BCRC 22168 / CBS 111 / JCM 3599 / NBRC 0793 / NRRL Y-1031 F-60-10) TaxID=1206466 RepID=K0K9B8_WICCF|nr:uncharacterized protein BN7_1046 [Wickerhamomyces ciferrii]CCH41505.1 hypothetical protein BN7_1046 [Wickerhamomyces ciferrii]
MLSTYSLQAPSFSNHNQSESNKSIPELNPIQNMDLSKKDFEVNQLQGSSPVINNINNESDDPNKHSYSCKRCRRLKKKCTRTIPECQNCFKANETCEYVPRAPRRKKAEILRSLKEQQEQQEHRENIQAQAQVQAQSSSSSTPVLRTQEPLSIPKVNPLQTSPQNVPIISHQQGYLDHNNSRSYNMGSTDPFSYKSTSALPPLSSITTNISTNGQVPQQQYSHYNNTNTTITSTGTTKSPQFTYHISPPHSRPGSDEFQIQSFNKSPIFPQSQQQNLQPHIQPQLQLQQQTQPQGSSMIQNKLLNSILGIDNSNQSSYVLQESITPKPNIDPVFIINLVKVFFNEHFHSYPFINRSQILETIMTFGIDKIDTWPIQESFEIYMILFISYCSLERIGQIQTDLVMKKYLISKSIEQSGNVITFDDINSIKYLILLGIYSLYDNQGFTSWHIAGNITRLVISLGLNRNSGYKTRIAGNNEVQRSENEFNNRIFWSAYNFDRLVSTSMGRPFGIDDDDVSISFPSKLADEDIYDIELIAAIISLRKIEGKVLKNVHSVNSSLKINNEFEKFDILKNLRIEIEDWYNLTNNLSGLSNNSSNNKNSIYNVSWFTSHYYQLTMMLYRPSFLIPNPSKETLQILGKSCLQALGYIYNLHTSRLLQPNWVNVYRFLTTCTTIIYCLCHWCIDLVESKTEINLCIEILDFFAERWPVAARSVQVFKNINKAIYDLKVTHDWQLNDPNELTNKFFEASANYHDVLNNNNIDIWFDDPIIKNSEH